ncbi:MAG: succinate dehydrogenase cytochrome b subunit [Candidatus Omnitrophica bacterium]|nr:succinate dehydrogenase cytochrome b subunit [Candidatus Omnitrophota bacterium]MBI3083645.1 succinate dehydrogenase cytochrome b subunit [Candidatus Omnitrophota bacterium]
MRWYRSSIGKKVLMAASGLVLLGFVAMHLLGNLLIYQGPDALNAYAKKLRDLGLLLWAARGGLLVALVVHVWTSIALSLENRRARPQRYAVQRTRETTIAARSMLVSGVMVTAYLVYHLLHFTFRVTNPDISHAMDRFGHPDVYAMVVLSFQQPAISIAYIIGMAAVCLHLSHGIGSACQSLGLNDERTIPAVAFIGRLIAVVLFIGYTAIPLSVLAGLVTIRGTLP